MRGVVQRFSLMIVFHEIIGALHHSSVDYSVCQPFTNATYYQNANQYLWNEQN